MNARIYDPQLGRFLSPDPEVTDVTQMQNFNRYSYVLNNPLAYTDPSGEAFITADGAHIPDQFGATSRPDGNGGAELETVRVTADRPSKPSKESLVDRIKDGAGDALQMLVPGLAASQKSVEAFRQGDYVSWAGYTTQMTLEVGMGFMGLRTPMMPGRVVVVPNSGLAVENRGVHYVLENSSKSRLAQTYEDALPGTTYDIATQKRLTPALRFDNPNPRGRPEVRFDGVDPDNSMILIDRKLNATTRSKQISDVQRWAEALSQNPSYSVRVEVPTQAAYRNMIRLINKAGVENAPISVRITP